MKMSFVKVSVAGAVLGVVVGCGNTDAPDANVTTAPATGEMTPTIPEAPRTSVPVMQAPVDVAEFEGSAVPPAGGNCALDEVNGSPPAGATAKGGSDVVFRGWIGDAGNQVPTEARLILKSDEKAYSAPLATGSERPDVAAALQSEALKASGYNFPVKLNVVPGTYSLSISHGSADAAAVCVLNASLIVTN